MSTYDFEEPRSNFGLYLIVAFLAAGLIGGGVFLLGGKDDDGGEANTSPVQEEPAKTPEQFESFESDPEPGEEPMDIAAELTPEEILMDLGMGVAELEPEVLLRRIGESLEKGEIEKVAGLIGKDALDEPRLRQLQALLESGNYQLSTMDTVVEIGELEANRRSRWVLNLEEKGKTLGSEVLPKIYFDLRRKRSGEWQIEKIVLPGADSAKPEMAREDQPQKPVLTDSLGIANEFLQAALAQNFNGAKSFVETGKVSDAKIAGLCIIFEEARYRLRPRKPLRAMFNRELTAGFMAHVQDETGEKAAEFGVSVQRAAPDQPWRITEVNLDSLLADYATRVAGGDVHYTPLIKNPGGGDTLILYFGFDEDELTPRTTRQLDIVAGLLKLDSSKKLTLSGHTDSLGSDDYNENLSGRRAGAVKKYLLRVGVPPSQIITLAEGEAKPRLPNQTQAGEDNPTGRRANRRTEIYLDF